MFMKKTIITILTLSLVLSGCGLLNKEQKTQSLEQGKVGLANPASTFCVEQGGELEMRENEDGQYGVCKFTDGSECEEWAFYRLECKPGDTEQGADNIEQGTQNIEQKEDVKTGNDKIKVFDIESGDNITSPVTIKGEGVAFENNLIVELRNNNHDSLVREHTTIKSDEIGKIGPFEITLNFNFSNTREGYVAVYEESAKDGSELNLVEIPVRFNAIKLDMSQCEEGVIQGACFIYEFIESCSVNEVTVDDYVCKCIDLSACPECPEGVECEMCLTGWECRK
jgi:putative hemolysin